MNIAIDLRSLSSGTVSGVENYCLHLVENLLVLDKQNQYTLFYNGFAKKTLPDFHYVNSRIKHTRWPNKLLNLSFKTGLIGFEKLLGETPDWLFMPNLSQFSLSPQTKLAITVHDLSPVVTPEFYDAKRRLWHRFINYHKAFERANVLFAVSEYTKTDLIKIFGIDSKKIKVIYPGVDRKVFNPNISPESQRLVRNLYNLPGDFILFLSTIEPRKNLANLIKAFEKTKAQSNLVIAGRPGWKYSGDFKLMKQSLKSAKIKYIGYVEEKYKAALIKLAKVLVYPSFYEGFGFQPLEAMAMGVPVIASQLTSLPEVAGGAALLVNPYDTNELARALDLVLNEQNLRAIMIQKGLMQSEKFNWQIAAEQTLQNLN